MNPKLKKFLIISAKQAVGAVIGNATLAALLPGTFNFHDWSSLLPFLKSTAALVFAAESKVWLPKLLAWVNSPTNGEGPFVPKP
jgi:hypothetical protein